MGEYQIYLDVFYYFFIRKKEREEINLLLMR